MASLARRIAPAAALGGLAIVAVGLLDPVFAHNGTDNAAQAATGGGNATATDSCANAQEVSGPTVSTRWGPVQVNAKVAGGKLCSAQAVTWPTGDGRSQSINAYAIPILDQAASAQGTAFDSVSGATYTSEGYRSSLQQLLDSL